MCDEWRRRGYKDNLTRFFFDYLGVYCLGELHRIRDEEIEETGRDPLAPSWLGMEALHMSHRAAPLRKNPGHYAQEQWEDVDTNMPYWWPA